MPHEMAEAATPRLPPRAWLLLLCLYSLYLVLGMGLFHHLECPAELEAGRRLCAATNSTLALLETVKRKLGKEEMEAMEQVLNNLDTSTVSLRNCDSQEEECVSEGGGGAMAGAGGQRGGLHP